MPEAKKSRLRSQKHDYQVASQVKDVQFCSTGPKEETAYEMNVNYLFFTSIWSGVLN